MEKINAEDKAGDKTREGDHSDQSYQKIRQDAGSPVHISSNDSQSGESEVNDTANAQPQQAHGHLSQINQDWESLKSFVGAEGDSFTKLIMW